DQELTNSPKIKKEKGKPIKSKKIKKKRRPDTFNNNSLTLNSKHQLQMINQPLNSTVNHIPFRKRKKSKPAVRYIFYDEKKIIQCQKYIRRYLHNLHFTKKKKIISE